MKKDSALRRFTNPKIPAASGAFICLLSAAGPAYAHGVSDQAKQRMMDGGLFDFAVAGAGHILTGYDHLLLLLGAVFVLPRVLDLLKFATLFTIGHTMTLLGATALRVGIDHHLVDAFVAVTVIGVGLINLGDLAGARRWLLIASPVFGLIHGFGLAAGIEEMTLPGDPSLWPRLVAFNVGVEAGQVTALVVAAAAVAIWRTSPSWDPLRAGANWALSLAGSMLLGLQLLALKAG